MIRVKLINIYVIFVTLLMIFGCAHETKSVDVPVESDPIAKLPEQPKEDTVQVIPTPRLEGTALKDQVVVDVAKKFNKSEADVYRRRGDIILRLKTINFATGSSELPPAAIGILTKVKEVIKDIGSGLVTIEGHTDATGDRPINEIISQDRAKSIADYFYSDKLLADNKFEYRGNGKNKPIATSKSKHGREQNRRVNIIIKDARF